MLVAEEVALEVDDDAELVDDCVLVDSPLEEDELDAEEEVVLKLEEGAEEDVATLALVVVLTLVVDVVPGKVAAYRPTPATTKITTTITTIIALDIAYRLFSFMGRVRLEFRAQ